MIMTYYDIIQDALSKWLDEDIKLNPFMYMTQGVMYQNKTKEQINKKIQEINKQLPYTIITGFTIQPPYYSINDKRSAIMPSLNLTNITEEDMEIILSLLKIKGYCKSC